MSVPTGLWRNKKNQELYNVERSGIINATNAQTDQCMVLYRSTGVEATNKPWYVREEKEFLEKFTLEN